MKFQLLKSELKRKWNEGVISEDSTNDVLKYSLLADVRKGSLDFILHDMARREADGEGLEALYPETQILENSGWSALLKCQKCGETFRDKQTKLRHQRERHGSMFTCLICGKEFSQRSGLSHHLPMHSDIKAFQCSICGKCFRQRSGLTHHKQTHSEVKAFNCDVCGKAFAQGSGLIHHKSTHSLVKNFTCHICGKSFAQRSGLAHHKNIHLKKLNQVIEPESTVSSRVMNFQQYLMSYSK